MTRAVQFRNNISALIIGEVTEYSNSVNIELSEIGKFVLESGKHMMCTLVNGSSIEIVKVTSTNSSTGVIYMNRAQEPIAGVTRALSFPIGSKIEVRLTAGAIASEIDRIDAMNTGFTSEIAVVKSTLNVHIANRLAHLTTKYDLGLGNVDNTSDYNKPLSYPQKVALSNLSNKLESLLGL